MEIGDTVKRTDRYGNESYWQITNKEELAYHQNLEESGFKYEKIDSVE